MAAPWEDVRDVLVRVGFGSPRPSTSSDEIIRVTRGTARPRGRDDDGQRQKDASASSSSRRRRRNPRTSNVDTNSPMASMLDAGDASTPLPRAAGSNSSTPADRQVRTSTTAMSSRARNRARGVRPVHQSPSQLFLDLSPAVDDGDGARKQNAAIDQGDGGDDGTAAALFAEALSPILVVPIPSRTSSMAALSDYGEQTNGSDVDLSEVHDMVDQIQRNLTEDLKEISTSINNYDDNTNTNIADGDKNGDDDDDGGSNNKAKGGQEGGTNGPEAVSCANDESPVESSTSAGADSTGDEIEAKTSATAQEGEAHQSIETLGATPPENNEEKTSSCCTCDCHEKPSPQNDVIKTEQTEAMTPPKYKYPITRESADAPARALCQTADEIHCRAEVAGVLSCMITDVEQAHWLTTDLCHRSEITCLQNQLESAQRILSERRLVEQSEQERRKALGDHLLVNLMSMGARLADAESYKIEMGELTTENKRFSSQLASALDQIKKVEAERDDALAAALKDRTLVEIEEMKNKGEKDQNSNVDEDWVSLKNGSKPLELVELQMPNTEEGGASVGEPPQRVKSTDFGVLVVEDQQRDHQDVEAKSGASNDKEEQLPPLLVLPERGLMVLFSFLEAEEILSVAELNMLMYSRVDALFGLGGETSNQEEGTGTGTEINQDSVDETREGHLSAPTIVEVPPPPSGPDEGAGPGRPIEPREAAPRIGLAGQAQEGAHLIGSAVGNAVSNLLWQRNLQRERNASNNGSSSSEPTKEQNEISEDDAAAVLVNAGSDAASTTNHQSSPPLLTAGLASKIASKLSPQELSVIIAMRTKINQLEEELVKGKERQDDLMAELRGIEGVKDFLVSKLRDVERSKSTKIDDAERTAKQVSSDQEVIGFLDNKVGELEMHCAKLSAEREQLKKELTEMRKEGKVRFLEDQIKLMRDEVADQGKQWKMEKKVLVKEVKENRHKLAVFEAEKRGMQSELTRLKRELSSSFGHTIRSPKMNG